MASRSARSLWRRVSATTRSGSAGNARSVACASSSARAMFGSRPRKRIALVLGSPAVGRREAPAEEPSPQPTRGGEGPVRVPPPAPEQPEATQTEGADAQQADSLDRGDSAARA